MEKTPNAKALEICKNITYTLKQLGKNPPKVDGLKLDEFRTSPKKSVLIKKRKVIMSRFGITFEDIDS